MKTIATKIKIMSVKETDKENATKTNTILTNKYVEHVHQSTMWSQKDSREGETPKVSLQELNQTEDGRI